MDFMFLSRFAPQLLSVLRIITALLFFAHGSAKFLGFPAVEGMYGIPVGSPGGIAGVLEIVGGILLFIGLFSRLTAFILSGLMAVAYFMVHAPQNFHPILNGGIWRGKSKGSHFNAQLETFVFGKEMLEIG